MSEYSIEKRVEALEGQVAELSKHLKTTIVLLLKQASKDPFKSPLESFFDGPDQVVFPHDPLEEFKRIQLCVAQLDAALQAAGADKDAQDAAYDAFVKCHNRASGFPV